MYLVRLREASGRVRPGPLGPFVKLTILGGRAYGVLPDAKFADDLAAVNPDGTWVVDGEAVTALLEMADQDVLAGVYEWRRENRLDIWTGRPLGEALPTKERAVTRLAALLRKMTAASRQVRREDRDEETRE